jgi:hypothetical protein
MGGPIHHDQAVPHPTMQPRTRELLDWLDSQSPLAESWIAESGFSDALHEALQDRFVDIRSRPTGSDRAIWPVHDRAIWITKAGRAALRKQGPVNRETELRRELRKLQQHPPDIVNEATIEIAEKFGVSATEIDQILEAYDGVLPRNTLDGLLIGPNVSEEQVNEALDRALERRLDGMADKERAVAEGEIETWESQVAGARSALHDEVAVRNKKQIEPG